MGKEEKVQRLFNDSSRSLFVGRQIAIENAMAFSLYLSLLPPVLRPPSSLILFA